MQVCELPGGVPAAGNVDDIVAGQHCCGHLQPRVRPREGAGRGELAVVSTLQQHTVMCAFGQTKNEYKKPTTSPFSPT